VLDLVIINWDIALAIGIVALLGARAEGRGFIT